MRWVGLSAVINFIEREGIAGLHALRRWAWKFLNVYVVFLGIVFVAFTIWGVLRYV